MISDLCKKRFCIYLGEDNRGCYCIKSGTYLDKEDNDSSCEDELNDFSEAD